MSRDMRPAIRRIARQSTIEKRHLAALEWQDEKDGSARYLPADEQSNGPGMGIRNRIFDNAARDLEKERLCALCSPSGRRSGRRSPVNPLSLVGTASGLTPRSCCRRGFGHDGGGPSSLRASHHLRLNGVNTVYQPPVPVRKQPTSTTT